MENVKGLTTKRFLPFFFAWLKELESYGYHSYYRVLNAKDYGIPQNRERIFVISIRNDIRQSFRFPKKQELKYRVEDFLEESADEKYYLKEEYLKRFVNLVDVDSIIVKAKDRISLPKTKDGTAPTITARSGNVGITNLISTAHYHMGGQLEFKPIDYVLNKVSGGVSKTLLTTYHKVSFANFVHDDGRSANAVINIKKL